MTDAARLDDTAAAALRDRATVRSDSTPLSSSLHGVVTHAPVNHVDHRGRVFEIYAGASEFWSDPVVYCYSFTVRRDQIKGWGLHEHKDDRYTLISGEVLTVLYDAQPDRLLLPQDTDVSGDGVGDDTRAAVADLVASDERIRFVDRPKSGRTGEPTRHEVLSTIRSPLIAYHGDDDLLFSDHLETMINAIDGHDFAHPLPVFIDPDGSLRYEAFNAA